MESWSIIPPAHSTTVIITKRAALEEKKSLFFLSYNEIRFLSASIFVGAWDALVVYERQELVYNTFTSIYKLEHHQLLPRTRLCLIITRISVFQFCTTTSSWEYAAARVCTSINFICVGGTSGSFLTTRQSERIRGTGNKHQLSERSSWEIVWSSVWLDPLRKSKTNVK